MLSKLAIVNPIVVSFSTALMSKDIYVLNEVKDNIINTLVEHLANLTISKRRDLTTGEVAKILRVSQQAVIRMCDSKLLPCYKVPSSANAPRRIKRQDLRLFMITHNMPMDGFPQD